MARKLNTDGPLPRGGRRRGTAFFELFFGLFFGFLGLTLALSALPPQERAPGVDSNPATFRAGRTLKREEPPPLLGPAYDDDAALPERTDSVVHYTLSARLDTESHTIDGKGVIEWTNTSREPVRGIHLHLYLNAFKNTQTLFLRAPFASSRTGRRPVDFGYIDVKALRMKDGTDLWKDAASHSPSDPLDETDIFVPLPHPVAPSESIALEVEWKSKLPSIVERTGYADRFHMVAQWFPKIARLEPSGTFRHFAFHAHAEFYSDFGTYDVTLDVPEGFLVGATGNRVEDRRERGRHVVRHRAEDVHDFAWTAWDRFVERREDIGGVAVRLLHPPGHERNALRTLVAVRHGLSSFGRDYGRYPYSVLTVVHPPERARGADGMEYPTLITTGGPWYAGYVSTFIERVTLHELGHQWFYGLVATDEPRFPFLDEGLTSYAESVAMRELFGAASGFRLFGLSVDGDAYARSLAAAVSQRDVIARPAAEFSGFRDLGGLVYARTATVLRTLGNVYGETALRRALGRYARRYRFTHPEPRHLLAAVREGLGDEAEAVLRAALFDGGWVDFSAQEPMSERLSKPRGVFDTTGTRETISAADPEKERYRNRALVYRHGTLPLPVDIELAFEDGSRVMKRWDGRAPWVALEHESQSPLVSVHVDPDVRISLDENLLNNAARAQPARGTRVLERGLYFAETLLSALGP